MSESSVCRDEWGHRFAVIGDVGGHLDELHRELIRLAADPRTGALPDDLVVVQVGDLIHRGPDSAGVIALVDRYLREQPGQWIQLVGNHEAQYLAASSFTWRDRLDDDSAATVRRWWSDGVLLAAAELHGIAGEDILITHAGLTEGYWRRVLGAPDDAGRVAALLNTMIGTRNNLLFRSGQMLGGGRPNPAAGPVWAAAATELLPGWLDGRLPFSQIHGHSSLFDWASHCFLADPAITARTVVDDESRHETTTLTGGRIIGIDPGHGATVGGRWRAWQPSASRSRHP